MAKKKEFVYLDDEDIEITSKNINSDIKVEKSEEGSDYFMAYVEVKDGNKTKNVVLDDTFESKEEAKEGGQELLIQILEAQKQPEQQPAIIESPMDIQPQQVM